MDWDKSYQNDETPWERGAPAPPLVEYLATHSISGRVLVPGCGLGHDVRHIAAYGCDVVGVDVSKTALERANDFSAPQRGSVTYKLMDFLDPSNGLRDKDFDCIFEHTCFCAIEPNLRPDYVSAVSRLLKPGGHLLAILFTNLDSSEGPPFPSTLDEVELLFGSRFEIERRWKPKRVYEGRENEESMYLMKRR